MIPADRLPRAMPALWWTLQTRRARLSRCVWQTVPTNGVAPPSRWRYWQWTSSRLVPPWAAAVEAQPRSQRSRRIQLRWSAQPSSRRAECSPAIGGAPPQPAASCSGVRAGGGPHAGLWPKWPPDTWRRPIARPGSLRHMMILRLACVALACTAPSGQRRTAWHVALHQRDPLHCIGRHRLAARPGADGSSACRGRRSTPTWMPSPPWSRTTRSWPSC